MKKSEPNTGATRRSSVTVSVSPSSSTLLRVGTRWEVVASTLDTLWGGTHTVTLVPIEDGRTDEADAGPES